MSKDAVLPHFLIQHLFLLPELAIDDFLNLCGTDFFGVEDHQRKLLLLCRQDLRRLNGRLDRFLDVLLVDDGDRSFGSVTGWNHGEKRGSNAECNADSHRSFLGFHRSNTLLL